MGIAGFQRWLLSNFPETVRVQGSKFGELYDHVAFDMNQIIHTAARRCSTRPALVSAIFKELDQILKNCVPQKSVFFAFDGPGPLAKLMTQRKRRMKDKTSHIASANVDQAKGVRTRNSKYAVKSIDRLELTPGCETLYYLRDAIEYWSHTRLQNDRKYRHVDIRISGADVPAEGELKIIDFCRSGGLLQKDSVIVVGGDADIVLQGLTTTSTQNFFVYLRKFGGNARKRTNYVVSVWELARSLERMFPGESNSVRLDFVLMSILNGNDYVPKVRGVNMSRLWKRYIKLKRPVGEGGAKFEGQYVVDADTRTFNWPMFFALMDRTGVPVPSIADALEESRSASPRPSKRKRPKEGYMTFSDSDVEEQILYTGNEDGIPLSDADADADAEAYIGDAVEDDVDEADLSDDDSSSVEEDEEEVDPEQSHIDNLVSLTGDASQFFDTERWFRTLLWTLQMYIDGYCGDYTFQYAKPYGPSSAAILQYIRDHDGDPFMLHAPVSSAPALLPHQAAMAMLPRRATHLLPTPVQKIFEDTAVVKKIFLGNERVNVAEMVKAINSIPESAFSPSELRLTRHGSVLLLRIPRRNDRVLGMNQKVWTPGTRYPAVAPVPVIFRKIVYPTSSPPGYKWPKGSFSNMMNLPYHKAKGMQLKVSTTAAPSKKVTPQQAPGQQKPPTGTTDTVEGENGGRVARRPGKAPVKRGKARTRRTSAPQSLGQAEDA